MYATRPPGTYKAVIKGKFYGGDWFDFDTTDSGVNPLEFKAINEITLDTDKDGLSDLEEKAIGTDPNNPDTDGDGVDDGTEYQEGKDTS